MSGGARAAARRIFLDAAGWRGGDPAPLAGDASVRRYFRLRAPRPAILMDAPPETGLDVAPFLAVAGHLRGLGLAAPEIFASDRAKGFVLMEDFGDGLFAALCRADPSRETPLYLAAAEMLALLHRAPPPPRIGADPALDLAPYDMAVLRREALLAAEWWAPAAGAGAGGLAEDLAGALAACAGRVAVDRSALVYRDCHAENLVWRAGATGLAQVGLLDFQDVLAGSPAYDIASLVEDARRDVSPEARAATGARYLALRPELDADRFALDLATLAAQRNLKILGLFTRLAIRDGKPAYLDLLPRVWAHLMRDLAHPALAGLAAVALRGLPEPTPQALAKVRAAAA